MIRMLAFCSIVFVCLANQRPAVAAGVVCHDDPLRAFAAAGVQQRIAYERMGSLRSGDVPTQDVGVFNAFTRRISRYLDMQTRRETVNGAAAILYVVDGDDLCAFLWVDRKVAEQLPDDARNSLHGTDEFFHVYQYVVIRGGALNLERLTRSLQAHLQLMGRGASRMPGLKALTSTGTSVRQKEIASQSTTARVRDGDAKADFKTILADASTILFPSPMQIVLSHVERLTIMPNSSISTFPLYALSPTGDGKPAVDKFVINVAAFPTELMDLGVNPLRPIKLDEKKRVQIFGNPFPVNDPMWNFPSLPGALDEARFVSELIGAQLLSGKHATPDKLLSALKEANLIYLAAHGMASDTSPIDGGFIAMHNGRVTARQVQAVKSTGRPLIVLSACQTGLGQSIDAGVIGLARAFQIAGASNTIMSLWRIDDAATKALMTTFAKKLNGRSPSDALRLAMIEVRKEYPDPLLWASFNVFGAGGIVVRW